MMLSIQYPEWIKPEIVPGFRFLRWYGLMYFVAFFITYLLYNYQINKDEFKKYSNKNSNCKKEMDKDSVMDLFFWAIVGLILGARIFGTLVYNPETYLSAPWLIFWPFITTDTGLVFVGFQGMSYHGGFIGAFVAVVLWAKKNKYNFLAIGDLLVTGIPLGYTFGRLGNFANGELYGRITASKIGMIFPQAPLSDRFLLSESWVREFAEKAGVAIQDGAAFINLPRHPSQLYEAFFEGIFLWLIIWLIRKKRPFDGFLICVYTFGYGFVRFFIEYFRQPDANIGYKISFSKTANIYIYESWTNISTGQIFCFAMMSGAIIGAIILWGLNKKNNGISK